MCILLIENCPKVKHMNIEYFQFIDLTRKIVCVRMDIIAFCLVVSYFTNHSEKMLV